MPRHSKWLSGSLFVEIFDELSNWCLHIGAINQSRFSILKAFLNWIVQLIKCSPGAIGILTYALPRWGIIGPLHPVCDSTEPGWLDCISLSLTITRTSPCTTPSKTLSWTIRQFINTICWWQPKTFIEFLDQKIVLRSVQTVRAVRNFLRCHILAENSTKWC